MELNIRNAVPKVKDLRAMRLEEDGQTTKETGPAECLTPIGTPTPRPSPTDCEMMTHDELVHHITFLGQKIQEMDVNAKAEADALAKLREDVFTLQEE